MSQARSTEPEPVAAARPPAAARARHTDPARETGRPADRSPSVPRSSARSSPRSSQAEPAPGVAALLGLQRGAGNAAVAGLVRRAAGQLARRPAPRPKPPDAKSTVAAGARPAAPVAAPSVPTPARPAAEPAPALDEGGGVAETAPQTPAPGLGDDELATLDQHVDAPPAQEAGPVQTEPGGGVSGSGAGQAESARAAVSVVQAEPGDGGSAPELGAAQPGVASGVEAESAQEAGPVAQTEPGGGGSVPDLAAAEAEVASGAEAESAQEAGPVAQTEAGGGGSVPDPGAAQAESAQEAGPVARTEPDEGGSVSDLGAAQAEVASGAQAEVDAAGADTGPEPEPEAGGGGGGGPIEEPPAPAPPDLAGAPPEQAMAHLGALPPAQMAATIGGVEVSAGAAVAREHGRLAAGPPRHTPLAATTTLAEPASSLVPASGAAHEARVGRVPSRAARPTPPPRPVPPAGPAPASRVTAPPLPAAPQGGLTRTAAHELAASITRLPVRDPGTQLTPGAAPRVALTGDADPGQVTAQQAQLTQGTAVAQGEGARDAGEPLGEDAVHPTTAVETMRAEIPAGAGGTGAAGPSGPAAAETGSGAADSAVSAVAEEQDGPRLRAAAGSAATAMAGARAEHVEQEQAQRRQSAEQIAGMEREHAEAESAERTRVRGEVAEQRTQWRTEQRALVTTAHAEAQTVVGTAGQTVDGERQRAETEAAEHHRQGEQEAAAARQEGEREAAQHRAEGQRESGGGGFFGWLASRAQSLFDRVKQGITAAFEKARQAVRSAIEKAQQLATAVIERARQAAVAAIRLAGTALTAIGDRVLAGFPALRDRFRAAIQARVRQAEAAVNRLAEGLKSGVRAALGLLGRGLAALLSGLERGLKAAVDGVAATVRGAIDAARAALQTLGAFMAIARDVASNPGAWLRNLAASVLDGIRNHLWQALKTAVQQWFNDKVEQVLGLGRAVWNLLTRGGISLAKIGQMAWQGIKQAIPAALIGILVEKLASMIIPAAGAVLAIIQGLQAAWGTVSRILQAIDRFVAFLRAVKSGNGGQAFAAAVAAAAVTVIDFVSNWLLARLARGASQVANKIRDIARRIGAALKRVVTRIGAALRRVGRRIGDRFRAWRERRGGRRNRETPADRRQRLEDRLARAAQAIEPKLNGLLAKGVGQLALRARLLYWRLRYRLTSLDFQRSGDSAEVWATINPRRKVARATALSPAQLRTVVNQAVADVLRDPEIRRRLKPMRAQAGENPDLLDVSGGEGWGAATQFLRTQGRRRPWSREQRTGVHGEGANDLLTRESRSPYGGPANAYVRGLGKGSYPDIAAEFAKTGIDDRQLAAHLHEFLRTGVAPRELTAEQAGLLGHASWLMFARESHRNRRNYAMAPMTVELVKSGAMTWQEAFAAHESGPGRRRGGRGMFPMSMEGAERAARELNPQDELIALRRRNQPARQVSQETLDNRRRDAQELERRETALVTMWVNMRLARDQGLVGLSAQAIGDCIRRMLREFFRRSG
ncbi:hypothetical protein [Amycolatopsis sp. lyj-23]|uniref:hypothetical protein n=1 Tax=Amycolatopsis sp. lyj-23 TaxID=2789283 RepID=UPI00397C531C